MALIRQANASTMAREAIVLDLGDLALQGELLKARARADAQRIIDDAESERERLLKGAAEEGRREGLAKGLEVGRRQGEERGRAEALAAEGQRLRALDAAWQKSLATFESSRDAMQLEARHDILRLAAAVAEMVTKRAVALEPSRVEDQLGAVLVLLSRATRLTIAVHPDDEPLLREAFPAIAARLGSGPHVEFVADGSLERGSCVARTGSGGVIDASIRTQLQRIVEVLLPGETPGYAPPAEGSA
jgi:flagellar assembly protein FliH